MKQIYDFERHSPPSLNENMLRLELEKQKVQRQTALLALTGILSQFVMIMLGVFAVEIYPIITVACFIYVLVTVASIGLITVVYTRKGGIILCQ